MKLHALYLASFLALTCTMATASAARSMQAGPANPSAPRAQRVVVTDTPAHGGDHTRRVSAKTLRPVAARERREAATIHPSQRVEQRMALRLLAMREHARQREQAQVDARAAHIYALSQTNAPILDDTRACKRTDAHGESIYENCALVGDRTSAP